MATLPFDLARIAPNAGDKYSPNLHAFLKKRGKSFNQVFRDAYGRLHLGFKDPHFNGLLLNRVLCEGKNAQVWWHGRDDPDDWTLVPDFWERYLLMGRCAIDTEHDRSFIGDEGRWKQEGDVRVCLWCGLCVQHLERFEEVVHRERWVSVPLLGSGEGNVLEERRLVLCAVPDHGDSTSGVLTSGALASGLSTALVR